MSTTMQLFQYLSYFFFALAGIALLIGIVIFFKLDIRSVHKELSGKFVKEQEALRRKNHSDAKRRTEIYSQKSKSGRLSPQGPMPSPAVASSAGEDFAEKMGNLKQIEVVSGEATEFLGKEALSNNFVIIKDISFTATKDYISN